MSKHATLPHSDTMTAESATRASVPAWLMSLVLHFVLLILLALGVRATDSSSVEESPRRIGIVLAQRDDERPFAYLDESHDPAQEAEQIDQGPLQATGLDNSQSTEAGLAGPLAPSSLLIEDIQRVLPVSL